MRSLFTGKILSLGRGSFPLNPVCRPMSFLSCGIASSFTPWRKLRMAYGTQSCRHARKTSARNLLVQAVLVVFERQP